jgi:ankyrin repeat protein
MKITSFTFILLFIACCFLQAQPLSREEQCAVAIGHNDVEQVKTLVKKGLDINYQYHGTPLLNMAIQVNNSEMARLLVSKGASVMLQSREGQSPLFLAAASDNVLLLDGVLSMRYQHDLKMALLYAIQANKPINVGYILNHLKEVNFQTDDDLNPLILASETGSLDIVKELLAHGARLDIRTKEGNNALLIAIKNNQDTVAQYLAFAEPSLVQQKDSFDNTPLHIALQNKNLTLTQFLLKQGADPNPANRSGETPFMIAMASDFMEGARLLLTMKTLAEPQMIITEFFRTLNEGKTDWVRIFAESGFNPDSVFSVGYEGFSVPIVMASSLGYSEIVDYLISLQVNLNRVDPISGETALTIACKNYHPEVALSLINAGCDPNIPDHLGNTAFSLALSNHQREITKRLLSDRFLINASLALRSVADSLHADIENITLYVHKSRFILAVVSGRDTLKQYDVSLGGNPVDDKLQQGDGCTPEGIFTIIAMYPHKDWSRFIYFDYPNAESWRKFNRNKAEGLIPDYASIGGEIGIHGVPMGSDDLIPERINWTAGCISLRNNDINELYDMVKCGQKLFISK